MCFRVYRMEKQLDDQFAAQFTELTEQFTAQNKQFTEQQDELNKQFSELSQQLTAQQAELRDFNQRQRALESKVSSCLLNST